MKCKYKVAIGIIVFVIILLPVVLSCLYTFTIRWPQQNETVHAYPGRLCIYSHSSGNYTGGAIYVKGSLDPYWCGGDNGTFVIVGCAGGSRQTWDANGTLIENVTFIDQWIPKNQSGLLVFTWQFS